MGGLLVLVVLTILLTRAFVPPHVRWRAMPRFDQLPCIKKVRSAPTSARRIAELLGRAGSAVPMHRSDWSSWATSTVDGDHQSDHHRDQ